MHHFMIMHIATLLIVAFFIFFAAQKAEGLVSLFGYILGALVVLGALYHIVGLFVPGMAMKMGMHDEGMMRGHWMHHDDMQPAAPMAPAVAPAPAKPASPAPAAPKKP
jgi:hypothetical protein